jgi:undecaprenyl-diphosphatase
MEPVPSEARDLFASRNDKGNKLMIKSLDIKIFYWLNNFAGQCGFFDKAVIFLADYSQYFLAALFLLFLFFSCYSRKKKIVVLSVTAVSAILARFGIVAVIRYLFYRPRPFLVLPVQQLTSNNGSSFPSGHAAFFFAMATAIYLYNKKWGIIFFVASGLMAVSRVIGGVHYPLDIIAGALIGAVVAYAIFRLSKIKILGKI